MKRNIKNGDEVHMYVFHFNNSKHFLIVNLNKKLLHSTHVLT